MKIIELLKVLKQQLLLVAKWKEGRGLERGAYFEGEAREGFDFVLFVLNFWKISKNFQISKFLDQSVCDAVLQIKFWLNNV